MELIDIGRILIAAFVLFFGATLWNMVHDW